MDESVRRSTRADRESMLSYGLIAFVSVVVSGLCGDALASQFPT